MSEPVASAAPEVQPDLAPYPLGLSDRQRWAIGAVLLLLAFGALGVYPLHEPDEGRYAELAAGMVRSGDWLHPRLSGIDYFEKPPLALWGVAAGLSLLGHSEAGARASTALAFLLTALLVGAWCGRLRAGRGYDPRGALLFAALPLSGFFSRVLLVDTPLTLWTMLCLYGLYRALVEPAPDARVPRRWLACAYAAAGLGMLTKGPIGVVLPVASAGGYLLLTRSWRRLPWLVWPPGVVLFAALSVPGSRSWSARTQATCARSSSSRTWRGPRPAGASAAAARSCSTSRCCSWGSCPGSRCCRGSCGASARRGRDPRSSRPARGCSCCARWRCRWRS
ncbi:MAG: glycosyltransferase family 39 protein [Planctomycetota bacterium]